MLTRFMAIRLSTRQTGIYIYPTPQRGVEGIAQIYSYDREKGPARGGAVPPDRIKIEIVVLDNQSKLNAEQWLAQEHRVDPGWVVKSQQAVVVDKVLGLRVEESKGPFSGIAVLLPREAKMYEILATPPDTQHLDSFNMILNTFKFPE